MNAPVYSVVIPARNAARTIGDVLQSLREQTPRPFEVIVVDDGSTDGTALLAADLGARVISQAHSGSAGGGRNRGWEVARGDTVVFLDADAIPEPGWATGLACAVEEFPGAIIGCARTFTGRTPWEWVSHLQIETPYLPRGEPREVSFVSSYCMAVSRDVGLRFDESYGGEDAIFCAQALAAGIPIVFDPRFHAFHDHGRTTFAELRLQQTRLAKGLARCGTVQREGRHKRVFSRLPVHYFLLMRLPVIYQRVRGDDALRRRFWMLLPRMVLAEWTLGLSALRYVARRPSLEMATMRTKRVEA